MIRFIFRTFSLLITLSICCFAAKAQHTAKLRTGNITLWNNASRWIDSMQQNVNSKDPVLALVHFNSLPTEKQQQQLKEQGVTLLNYVPDNTYTAFIRFPLANKSAAVAAIYGISDMKAEWKADDYVWKKVNAAKGMLEVLVTFYPGINNAAVKQFAAAMGAQINAGPMEQYGSYKMILAADKMHALAAWYGVQNISPVTSMVPYDLQSRPAVKGNVAVASATYGGYGLTGDSVTVGVGDNSSGVHHADIKDRITNFNPGPVMTHGAHVNGIVGGAGTVDPLGVGMATHVSLIDYLYDQVLPATGAMYHDYNMTITNNSYGVLLGDCDYSGTYDGYSRFLDTLSVQYPDVLHVFASGNDGWMSCSPYPSGFATVGGGYQPAKNNVVVGSMTDLLYQAPDESRGPTKDGRMKPETVAVGLGAYSTIGTDDYEWAAGTSMAAPQVAGGLALLTQRYKQLHGGITPRGDILKTILLNGSMDLGNVGPDFCFGFGSMDLARSLKIMDAGNYYVDTLNNHDSATVTINVPANTAQMKVMLCWHDVPASTSSATQLVNDLDLSVSTPTGTVHLPLVCDATPANVNNIATEKADHLNNVEQVTIDNPAAGTYAVKVKGYNVPYPAQRYVVAYDFIAAGTQLTYPLGGEQLSNVDTIRIFWNTVDRTHTFKVEFSPNNGGAWNTIADNIPATTRFCSFMPSGLNTGNCLVRITKNGTTETQTSGRFVINTQPVAQLAADQCPGYVNIHWSPVTNAGSYELLKKQGAYMQVVGTTTDTNYSFSGMSLTEKSYVAVRPILTGQAGYRSKAVITIANNGSCSNPASNGDLMVVKAITPTSGRQYTSSQPGTNETLTVQLKNLDNVPCGSFELSYSINGGAWTAFSTPPIIPANDTILATAGGIDLSAIGSYNFIVALHNLALTDPQTANDTLRFTVKNIPNDTITLPFLDDFETMGRITVNNDSIGISPNGHWDFSTNDSAGRMRSFVNENVTITGNRSISLDEKEAVRSGSNNMFIGTFNLATYDTATTEVRLDFDYVLHGTPKTADGNVVTARANDLALWLPIFTYNLNAYPGFLNRALSVSLTDVMRSESRNFSSSTQVSFGQNDTSLIGARNYGNGITIDNVRLYTVANDAQVVSVVSPLPTNCGLPAAQPLTIKVHNGVNYTLHNVQLFYRVDSGTIFTGILDSITAKSTVDYTFAQLLNAPAGTSHQADIWLSTAGDTYLPNDSLMGYKFRNNQIITEYPYLENFEAGNGGYYSDGINSSWQYGTPTSPIGVNKAASGTKAWKTNLSGRYNNLEQSYLYSPCFDVSGINEPMLSFSAALDVEYCGNTLCDKAYVEYTYDGMTWHQLGSSGQGTNWYDSTFNAWTHNGFSRWHVASILIPKPVGSGSVINFRFVLSSDPAANFDGFGVDDIHIFDLANNIFPASGTTVATNNLSGNSWIDYLQDNKLLASVQPNNQNISATAVTLYEQTTYNNPTYTQHIMPRSYAIPKQDPTDSVGVRLYLLESELVKVLEDTACPSCPAPADAYRLGITQFSSADHENNTLADDSVGTFSYKPYQSIQWVPYDQGYYAQFKTKTFSEYWFNDGGPTAVFPTGVDYLNFTAYRDGASAQLFWTSLIDTAVANYTLERSTDGSSFAGVYTTPAQHVTPGIYSQTDNINILGSADLYYRLKWTMTGRNTVYYSPIRELAVDDSVNDVVTLNAQMIRKDAALVDWTSYIDGTTSKYTLERAINNGAYATINTATSQHHYAQHYSYTDAPEAVKAGDLVHYRLTAKLDNGSNIVLPIKTVEWTDANSVANIYPNPNSDGLVNIVWYAAAGTQLQVSLIDMGGKRFFEANYQSGQWKNVTQVQTPTKPKGIYILHTIVGGKSYSAKVVFE